MGRWRGRVRVHGLAGLLLCPVAASTAPAPPPRPPAVIYAKVCGYCHGAHVAPVIRGRALPADYIALMVRTGPRAMPAFHPTEIGDAELKSLAAWVSTSSADPQEHEQ